MASFLFNNGKQQFALGEIDWVDDMDATGIYILLVDDTAVDEDWDDVADVTNEVSNISGVGYERKALDTPVVDVDDVNDQVDLDAADVSWTAINAGTVGGAIIYKNVGGVDANSPLIAHVDFTAVTTNGGDLTLVFNSAGVIRFS